MLFFARIVVAFFSRWMVPLRVHSLFNYAGSRKKVVEWHRNELKKLDRESFERLEAETHLREVIRRRAADRSHKLAGQP